MPIIGSYKLEIMDLANTSGSPVLAWAMSEGSMDGSLTTEFQMKYQLETEKYAVPMLMRSVGPSLTHPDKLSDPFMHVNLYGSGGKQIVGDNDDWGTYPNQAAINAIGLAPDSVDDSMFQTGVLNKMQTMITTGTDGYHWDKRARNDLFRIFQPNFRVPNIVKSGTQSAWLSYDVSSGMNNRNVFAYSIELLERVSGLSGTWIQDSGDYYTASNLLFYSGFAYSGNCNNVMLLLDDTGVSCSLPDGFGDEEAFEVCLPTGLSSGALKRQALDVLQALTEQESKQGQIQGDPVDNSQIVTDNISLNYVIFQGVIAFNSPYVGDAICIEPYTYDYTGDYQQTYGVNPPYPMVPVCLAYGTDYTSADTLAAKINQTLSGVSFNLWNRNVCADDTLSGQFETGGMLKAVSSGNLVTITALREGLLGLYKFTFIEADRPETGIDRDNVRRYMMPKRVRFQGANVYGTWTDLDTRNNVNWPSIRPIKVRDTFYEFYTGYATGSDGRPQEESGVEVAMSGRAVKRLVYEATISGTNKCGLSFQKDVEFYEVPSGFTCKDKGDSDDIINVDPEDTGDGSFTGVIEHPVDYFFLKTGFKFSNTGNYNYYRILLEQFTSDNKTQNVQLEDSFYINGITLYGVESGNALLSGQMCLVGGTYQGQVMGYTSGLITGTLSGVADASGRLCFSNYLVTGTPNGDGTVQFQRSYGKATTAFSGLVSQCVTGTGYYIEYIEGFYWDAANNCVSFEKPVSGIITGLGNLTGGPYAIIRDAVIATLTGTQIVHGTGTGILTGIVPNFSYNFSNIPAFGYISGSMTLDVYPADSGVVHISQVVYGIPTQAYSVALSGTKQASGRMVYNTPAVGDQIFINGAVVIYDTNVDNQAPTYFKTLAELAAIVNDNSETFLATGYEDGTNLYLFSTLPGASGNAITLSSTGSIGVPTFASTGLTGGADYFYPLMVTDAFSGQLDMDLFATGYFEVSGSGYLTGSIKQLDFIRYFTGVWGLSSGDMDFQLLGWVTGNGNSRYQNSGFTALPFYTGRPNAIPLLVTYNNNPLVLTTDYARLRVTGYGTQTGVEMILSGQY